MDAFAVSICKGLAMKKATVKAGLTCGIWFGGFQALMPLIGYYLGVSFADSVADFDHWIAFVLLGIIGGKMIKEAFEKDCGCCVITAEVTNNGSVDTQDVVQVYCQNEGSENATREDVERVCKACSIHDYIMTLPHGYDTQIGERTQNADGSYTYPVTVTFSNNITTEEHPLGVYHPHAELHHIKKENIGLIEVMGLAVLPSRLKSEMATLADALVAGEDLSEDEVTAKHAEWVERFTEKYVYTGENVEEILHFEIGKTFEGVLEDAGVYKRTPEGNAAFLRFIDIVK